MNGHPGNTAVGVHLPKPPRAEVGIETGLEFAFLFLDWAARFRQPPPAQAIAYRWGVGLATAYRYRLAYLRFLDRRPS